MRKDDLPNIQPEELLIETKKTFIEFAKEYISETDEEYKKWKQQHPKTKLVTLEGINNKLIVKHMCEKYLEEVMSLD